LTKIYIPQSQIYPPVIIMADQPIRIKLLVSGRYLSPYVSRVVRGGRVQKAFAEQIGHPVGACVRRNVHKGMAQSDIRNVVKQCAIKYSGTHLNIGAGPGSRSKLAIE